MKTLTFLLFILVSSSAFSEELSSLAKKFPYGMLTSDHGIVTEEDLAIDAWSGFPHPPIDAPPYGPEGYNRWKCFPIREVKIKIRTWRDADAMELANQIVTMCDLQIWIDHPNDFHVYSGRRAKEVTYCRDFKKAWKKLTEAQNFACFNGEYHEKRPPGKSHPSVSYQSWTWNKVKTHQGCYSYFIDECDLSYWKKQGYPDPRNSQSSH